ATCSTSRSLGPPPTASSSAVLVQSSWFTFEPERSRASEVPGGWLPLAQGEVPGAASHEEISSAGDWAAQLHVGRQHEQSVPYVVPRADGNNERRSQASTLKIENFPEQDFGRS